MPHSKGSRQIRKAYAFLKQVEIEERSFTLTELVQASGWSEKTAKSNLTKKLGALLHKSDMGHCCVGIKKLTEEAFCRLCSQNSVLATDLLRPVHPPKVDGYVNKAREAALAAVQHYNNPTSQFRSANYIVLMIIAFTALFHAVFERDGVEYTETKTDGSPKVTGGGDTMLWDMMKSAVYYETMQSVRMPAMITNLVLMVGLRHKIEHQYMPQFDTDINGHCQSLLMNFERVLVDEFTEYYSLNTALVMALQFSTARSPASVAAQQRFQGMEYDALKQYLSDFQAGLPDTILADPSFAFRVWLVPKTASSIKKSDHCLEFVAADRLSPELLAEFDRQIVAVKRVERESQSIGMLLPKAVAARVQAGIGKKFTPSSHHSRACQFYKVRPNKTDPDQAKTDTRYCIWNVAVNRHLFTEAWVDFLISEYKDDTKYKEAFCSKPKVD